MHSQTAWREAFHTVSCAAETFAAIHGDSYRMRAALDVLGEQNEMLTDLRDQNAEIGAAALRRLAALEAVEDAESRLDPCGAWERG